jgi:magnesium transporter
MNIPAPVINDLHLEDLCNAAHPSLFDINPGYDMLIIRLPVIDNGLEVRSTGFILTPDHSFLYHKHDGIFEPLADRFNAPYRILDARIDHLLKAFTDYQERVADLEDLLYADRAGGDFMTHWLGLKRDILRIERVVVRAATTLKEVIAHYAPLDTFPADHYSDLYEHTDRTTRSAALQLSKLDYIYNFYSARTNEKMNRLIYLLTVISAIFLPLNLLVGFFGMNTGGLPFTQGASGTEYAALLMLALLFTTSVTLYLWHKKRVKAPEGPGGEQVKP